MSSRRSERARRPPTLIDAHYEVPIAVSRAPPAFSAPPPPPMTPQVMGYQPPYQQPYQQPYEQPYSQPYEPPYQPYQQHHQYPYQSHHQQSHHQQSHHQQYQSPQPPHPHPHQHPHQQPEPPLQLSHHQPAPQTQPAPAPQITPQPPSTKPAASPTPSGSSSRVTGRGKAWRTGIKGDIRFAVREKKEDQLDVVYGTERPLPKKRRYPKPAPSESESAKAPARKVPRGKAGKKGKPVEQREDTPREDTPGEVQEREASPEKPKEPWEIEDPVWTEFSQEYYEVVEQLPLEIHRNFALLRELDDQTQRQTGQLLELIRKYVAQRLPSPVPRALQEALSVKTLAKEDVKNAAGGSGQTANDGTANGSSDGLGSEPPRLMEGPSIGSRLQDLLMRGPMDGSMANEKPAENTNNQTTSSDLSRLMNGLPESNGYPHSSAQQQPGVQRMDTLKTRQAEMYANNLVPAMASRALLPEIGKLARDMLRSADEKVGIAIGTYNTVDRHIRSLDAALQAQQAALNLGIRQDTLPSHAITGASTTTAGEEGQMMQAGGKADVPGADGALPTGHWRQGTADSNVRAVDALNVGLSTAGVAQGRDGTGTAVGEPRPIVLGYMAAHNFDLAVDPNEPRYCFCQNVSYGEMVGCENMDCPNGGWFHLGCLGMTSAPQGKWWCDQCRPSGSGTSGQKRKKRKY